MMFRRFRAKILIMNILIISVLLLLSSVAVYISTSRYVLKEVEDDLRHSYYTWNDVRSDIESEGKTFDIETFNNYISDVDKLEKIEARLGLSYIIQTDNDLNITGYVGFYNIDYSEFNEIITKIDKVSLENQIIRMKDRDWAYRFRKTDEGYSLVLRDVTARMDILDQLILTSVVIFLVTLVFVVLFSIFMTNKSIKPLDEAYSRQKTFISNASHELKTPLTSIGANTDLLLTKAYIREPERKWIEYIKAETNRMSNLTNELLYMAEIDEKPLDEISFFKLDLGYILNQSLLGIEAVAYEKNILLESNIETEIFINGEADRIRQLILILLDNALKYTPKGGLVKVVLSKSRNIATLSVSNSGSYIPPDKIERIFDRFFKLDDSRGGKPTSYGLGLSIAKTITYRHGGTLDVTSVPGGFTTFTVKFKSTI